MFIYKNWVLLCASLNNNIVSLFNYKKIIQNWFSLNKHFHIFIFIFSFLYYQTRTYLECSATIQPYRWASSPAFPPAQSRHATRLVLLCAASRDEGVCGQCRARTYRHTNDSYFPSFFCLCFTPIISWASISFFSFFSNNSYIPHNTCNSLAHIHSLLIPSSPSFAALTTTRKLCCTSTSLLQFLYVK